MGCKIECEMALKRQGHNGHLRRCDWAIQFGTLATRCKKSLQGHGQKHEGRGLDQFPFQIIEWAKGNPREFQTEREDFYAWEVHDVEVQPGANDPS